MKQPKPVSPLRPHTLWLCAALCGALAWPALAQQSHVPESSIAPATPNEPLLPFADFFKRPMGSRGAEMTPALLAANGQRVRLRGYMVQQERAAQGRFLFTPRPVHMSEQADGDADDLPAAWAMVYLDPAQQDFAIPYQRGLLELSGVLNVGRLEESDGRVSWVRLQLDSKATRGMNAVELAHYLQTLQHDH